jgi:hypothetical protein
MEPSTGLRKMLEILQHTARFALVNYWFLESILNGRRIYTVCRGKSKVHLWGSCQSACLTKLSSPQTRSSHLCRRGNIKQGSAIYQSAMSNSCQLVALAIQ